MKARNVGATFAGFGVAAVILGLLVYFVGADAVLDALGRSRARYAALVGVAIVAWLCLWGIGLQVVFAAVGAEISSVDAVLVHAGTAFANHVTPFGQAGGEPVGAWLLSSVSGTDVERSLAAMTSFDAINVVPSLTFATLGLAYYASVTTLGERLYAIAVGLVVVVSAFATTLVLASRHRDIAKASLLRVAVPPIRTLGRVLPGVEGSGVTAVEERIEGFVGAVGRVSGDRRRLAVALGFSTAGWAAQAAGLWVAFHALGTSIPVYVPLFVVPLGTVASVLPTPGGLGGIEAVQVTLLLAATDVAAPTVTAVVAIFSIGGFFLTTSLGAAAVAVLRVRARSTGFYR